MGCILNHLAFYFAMQRNKCVLIQTLALISVLSLVKLKFASVLLDWKSVLKIHQLVLVG